MSAISSEENSEDDGNSQGLALQSKKIEQKKQWSEEDLENLVKSRYVEKSFSGSFSGV